MFPKSFKSISNKRYWKIDIITEKTLTVQLPIKLNNSRLDKTCHRLIQIHIYLPIENTYIINSYNLWPKGDIQACLYSPQKIFSQDRN